MTIALATATLAGCGGTEPVAASNEPPSSAASTSEPAAGMGTPLHGSWRLDLTEAQMVASLTAAGYGDRADEFFEKQDIDGAISQVLTIEGDRFAIANADASHPWTVPWYGPVTITDDTVTLDDEKSGTVDTLRWALNGDQLSFVEVVDTNDLNVLGLPNELYLAAYLMAAPFQRTDCIPTEDDCEG